MKQPVTGARLLCAILGFATFGAVSTAAAATCADRDHVSTQLAAQFGEAPIANQISHNNRILEIYASPDAQTWSIVITLPERNLSCLAATGKGRARLKRTLGALT